MPTVEKTRGGTVVIQSVGRRFSIGDLADVSESEAAYLCEERGDFERVGGTDTDETAPAVDEWHDWNEDDWIDLDYQQRTDDVEAGRVDGHLDAIEAVETSETVTDAVQDRRSEIGED